MAEFAIENDDRNSKPVREPLVNEDDLGAERQYRSIFAQVRWHYEDFWIDIQVTV